MLKDFRIQIASDTDYEYVFVEIYHKGRLVAAINQESGPSELNLELPYDGENYIVPLNWFLEAIAIAKKRLVPEDNQ